MQSMTNINESAAQGGTIADLPAPWNELLNDFANSTENHRFNCPINTNEKRASVNLHKADIGTPANSDAAFAGQVILMEDRTEFDTLEAELAHSERLASVGRLAAGVAHEIGNPLTGIASIAQNMAHDATSAAAQHNDEDIDEQANDILNQVNRINGIVRSLLNFSHEDKVTGSAMENVLVEQSVQEALNLVQLASGTKALDFEVNIPQDTCVLADSNQLVQVFVNLINNASDASPPNSLISIEGELDDQSIHIAICDSGPGIDSNLQERIFEPFLQPNQ